MLDAYIIERIEKERLEREDRERVPLHIPVPAPLMPGDEEPPAEEEGGAVEVDFVV
jgi:hypothetical protein